MPDLLTYYKSLTRREKGVFNRKIHADAGIPYVTFAQKLNKKGFSVSEQIVISQILNINRSELFPVIIELQNKLQTTNI